MRLNAEGLAKQLNSNALLPLYLVSGNEPLLMQESVDLIHAAAQKQGFIENTVVQVEAPFKLDLLQELTVNLSLFAEKRRLELRCGDKLPAELTAWLQNYAAQSEQYQDLCLIVTTGKLSAQQQKAKWWTALEQKGAVVTIWEVDLQQYPRWLDQRLATQNLRLTPAARQLLIEQSEGNLLASTQILAKLALMHTGKVIDVAEVEPLLANHAHYDLFDLSSQVLLGNAKRSLRILRQLQHEEEAILILWVLSKEIKTLLQIHTQKHHAPLAQIYRNLGIWEKRQQEIEPALRRLSLAQLYQCLEACAEIDLLCKGLKEGNVWFALKQLVLSLTRGFSHRLTSNVAGVAGVGRCAAAVQTQ